VMIYRSPLLGKEHYGTALTCEPTGNLVHQEVLTPRGATFTSKPSRATPALRSRRGSILRTPIAMSHSRNADIGCCSTTIIRAT